MKTTRDLLGRPLFLLKQAGSSLLKRAGEAAGMLPPSNSLIAEHLCVLGAITTLVTIATELTTNRANMHLNGAGDRAKGATLFVELSNCVSFLTIQLVVSHFNLQYTTIGSYSQCAPCALAVFLSRLLHLRVECAATRRRSSSFTP